MSKARLILTMAVLGRLAFPVPAQAWDIRDDERFSFLFHRYGDDMDRPAITPARPYWHEDAAVPPSQRWHDRTIEVVDEYGFNVPPAPQPEVVEISVGVEAGVDVLPPPLPLRHAHRSPNRRLRRRTAIARRDCPPARSRDASRTVDLAPEPAPSNP